MHLGDPGEPPVGWGDIWIVKINDQRDIVWQKSLGGIREDTPYYIDRCADGSIIILSNTNSSDSCCVRDNHSMPGSFDNDLFMVKLSGTGEFVWQKCIGGWGDDLFESIHTVVKKGDYDYVVAAETDYKSGNDDIQCDIHTDNRYDAWVFELDTLDTTDIIENLNIKNAVRVYPNPAKEYVVFECPLLQAGGNVVLITDVFGRQVAEVELRGGKTVWDCREIKAGVYFYSANSGNVRRSGKVVIQ
jgi:hypothetical protein